MTDATIGVAQPAAGDLTALETEVLRLLLAGPDPVSEGLRAQLEGVQVAERERSGVGFFTSFTTGADALPGLPSLHLGDVVADLRGVAHGAGFVLFVRGGRLQMLEGYTFGGEAWPDVEEIVDVRTHPFEAKRN